MTAFVIGIVLGLVAAIHGARLAYRAGENAGFHLGMRYADQRFKSSIKLVEVDTPPTETRH